MDSTYPKWCARTTLASNSVGSLSRVSPSLLHLLYLKPTLLNQLLVENFPIGKNEGVFQTSMNLDRCVPMHAWSWWLWWNTCPRLSVQSCLSATASWVSSTANPNFAVMQRTMQHKLVDAVHPKSQRTQNHSAPTANTKSQRTQKHSAPKITAHPKSQRTDSAPKITAQFISHSGMMRTKLAQHRQQTG